MMSSVRFRLFTRRNKDECQEISPTDLSTIWNSNFNPKEFTRIVIHGYTENGNVPWMKDMCQTFLKIEDCNCVITDWGASSMTMYAQAANTIYSVGENVASLLNALKSVYPGHCTKIHLIGHSLGSHIAGHAGRLFPNITRITGLDPANIYFENTPPSVRMDKCHAKLVDVIHTSSRPFTELGLGLKQAVGHLDFYPNKGDWMPECNNTRSVNPVEVLCLLSPLIGPLNYSQCGQAEPPCPESTKHVNLTMKTLSEYNMKAFCDHYQAIQYFKESIIDRKKFRSFPCESAEKAQAGECPTDGAGEGLPTMGFHASSYKGATSSNQVFVLKTC